MTETPMPLEQLRHVVYDALEDMKAERVVVFDVRGRTPITDLMFFAGGTSRRHVKSIAERVQQRLRDAGLRALGVEGAETADWVLIDLGDAVVHVMRDEVRDFYRLENIWGVEEREEPLSGEGGGV